MRSLCQTILLVSMAGLVSPLSSRATHPDPPLPTLQEIFPHVVERAQRESENDRSFESQFSFVKSKVTETLNSKGEVKKHEAKISTNNPALKKLAGRPAPVQSRALENGQPVSDRPAKGRGKASEKEKFVVNDDFVKRFEFTLVGRETLNGRPALVLDFVPAKARLPERDLKDKFFSKTAGRVWLDEEDYAIAKGALRLTDRVNVVGGLVGAVWKLNFGFERERTEEGLWFAREAHWHLEGRELFTNRTMDYHEERTDVRRAQ